MMQGGKLHESVAFDSPTPQSDGQGGQENGWTERLSTRANFRFLRGGEKVLQSRLQGVQTVVVTVRKYALSDLITNDWRMRDTRRGVTYNIRSIIPTDDRSYLEITAESGVAV